MWLLSGFLAAALSAVAFTICGTLVARRFVRRHFKEHHHDVLVPIFLTGGTIYAVFLAFLVVSVWASHDTTKTNVATEASGLSTMYRAAAGMEPVSRAALRALIRGYTEDVVTNEWPIQSGSGGTSAKARAAAVNMFEVFGHLNAAARQNDFLLDQAELQLLNQTLAVRNARVLEASDTVSPVIWIAAIASGLITIVMTFFLYMETVWLQLVMASFLATMICMLLCVTFMLSKPFSGPLAIQPDPFAHSLFVYNDIDAMK